MAYAVSRRLRPGFDTTPIRGEFVVDKAELGKGFLQVLSFLIPPMFLTCSFFYH